MKLLCLFVCIGFSVIYLTDSVQGIANTTNTSKPGSTGDQDDDEQFYEWSFWSPCSRSCGIGVRFRGKLCLRKDKSLCKTFPRENQACNTQSCPANSKNFRDVQCSRFNDQQVFLGETHRWIAHQRGYGSCRLFCRREKHARPFFFGRAVDGTQCGKEPYSVCVYDKCVPIGCDGNLDSQVRLDKCRVCGGNNTTCEHKNGTLKKVPTKQERSEGYAELLRIPKGATSVMITEMTHNYIALKNANGEYLLNGNRILNWPRMFKAGSTQVKYERKPGEKIEMLNILGPTSEQLIIMIMLMWGPANIKYSYWRLPENTQAVVGPTSGSGVFEEGVTDVQNGNSSHGGSIWGEWTICTKSCGGGFRVRARKCGAGSKNVCDGSETETAKCNEMPCKMIKASWSPWRPWTRCSATCGGGARMRFRHCRYGNKKHVKHGCPGKKFKLMLCNTLPCPTTTDKPTTNAKLVPQISSLQSTNKPSSPRDTSSRMSSASTLKTEATIESRTSPGSQRPNVTTTKTSTWPVRVETTSKITSKEGDAKNVEPRTIIVVPTPVSGVKTSRPAKPYVKIETTSKITPKEGHSAKSVEPRTIISPTPVSRVKTSRPAKPSVKVETTSKTTPKEGHSAKGVEPRTIISPTPVSRVKTSRLAKPSTTRKQSTSSASKLDAITTSTSSVALVTSTTPFVDERKLTTLKEGPTSSVYSKKFPVVVQTSPDVKTLLIKNITTPQPIMTSSSYKETSSTATTRGTRANVSTTIKPTFVENSSANTMMVSKVTDPSKFSITADGSSLTLSTKIVTNPQTTKSRTLAVSTMPQRVSSQELITARVTTATSKPETTIAKQATSESTTLRRSTTTLSPSTSITSVSRGKGTSVIESASIPVPKTASQTTSESETQVRTTAITPTVTSGKVSTPKVTTTTSTPTTSPLKLSTSELTTLATSKPITTTPKTTKSRPLTTKQTTAYAETSNLPRLVTTLLPTKQAPTSAGPTELQCPPCAVSKKRNKSYCKSDYVLKVRVRKERIDKISGATIYRVNTKIVFVAKISVERKANIWVFGRCTCPRLKLNVDYLVMGNLVSANDKGTGGYRLSLNRESYVKEWKRGMGRKIQQLKGSCFTGQLRRI